MSVLETQNEKLSTFSSPTQHCAYFESTVAEGLQGEKSQERKEHLKRNLLIHSGFLLFQIFSSS